MSASRETIDLMELRERSLAKEPEAPLVGRELKLQIKYVDPDGGKHEDSVLSRILDGDERRAVARFAAGLAKSPWENFPTGQQVIMWAIATLLIQLRKPPAWLLKWIQEDDVLLMTIYSYCQQHDAFFFGGDSEEGDGSARASRVAVTSSNPAIAPTE